jgi:hypothetical protein
MKPMWTPSVKMGSFMLKASFQPAGAGASRLSQARRGVLLNADELAFWRAGPFMFA